MELGLNLFWLLLALSSFALWQRQRSRTERRSRHRKGSPRSLLALGCTLAVLFPIISITDDLHSEQAIMEDSNSSKRTLKNLGASHASPNSGKFSHPSPQAVPPGLPSFSDRILGCVTPAEVQLATSVLGSSSEGRGPPLPLS